jgi:hypothetical protein
MKNVTPTPPRSHLMRGIALMLIGGYLLMANLGYGLPFSLLHFLPLPFIAVGVWGLIFPNRHVGRDTGVWALTLGLYFACGVYHLFGLSWGSAWPIFLVGLGLAILLGPHGDARCRRHRDRDADGDQVIHGA